MLCWPSNLIVGLGSYLIKLCGDELLAVNVSSSLYKCVGRVSMPLQYSILLNTEENWIL